MIKYCLSFLNLRHLTWWVVAGLIRTSCPCYQLAVGHDLEAFHLEAFRLGAYRPEAFRLEACLDDHLGAFRPEAFRLGAFHLEDADLNHCQVVPCWVNRSSTN